MLVEESFIEGKHTPLECEDSLLISENFLAVFDGMSSPLASDGARSGRQFAQAAAKACAELPADATAEEAVGAISLALAALKVKHLGPYGAVGAIFSKQRKEIWRVGDVHLRVNDVELLGEKQVDVAMAGYRAAFNAATLAIDTNADILNQDPGLEAVSPLLAIQGALANFVGPFGYGVFNGQSVPAEHIEVYSAQLGDEIVIATDGFLSAAQTLEIAEEELAEGQRRDPLALGELSSMAKCLRPGFHAHDDRTYLRFRVEQAD